VLLSAAPTGPWTTAVVVAVSLTDPKQFHFRPPQQQQQQQQQQQKSSAVLQ